MIADFFTKPLQGKLFYKFRDLVMGIQADSPHHSSRRSVLESRASKQSGTGKNMNTNVETVEDSAGWEDTGFGLRDDVDNQTWTTVTNKRKKSRM